MDIKSIEIRNDGSRLFVVERCIQAGDGEVCNAVGRAIDGEKPTDREMELMTALLDEWERKVESTPITPVRRP